MTRQERVAVLEGELESGYEEFDGMIISEAERARRESNEAGSDPGGLYDEERRDDGGSGADGSRPGSPGSGDRSGGDRTGSGSGTVVADSGDTSGSGGRQGPEGEGPEAGGSGGSVGGPQGGPANNEGEETYPVPDDIPSGRDDDVVASQIREAAMNESDPELRERLWDEYRRYKGLDEGEDE